MGLSRFVNQVFSCWELYETSWEVWGPALFVGMDIDHL